MAIVQPSTGEAPALEDALYTLKIISAVQGLRENYDDKTVMEPYLRVNMAVADTLDDEGNPIVLRTDMTLKWSSGGTYAPSTLYLYATAFGVNPGPDKPFDTDLLVGRVAQGMVRTPAEGGWPKVIKETLMPVKAVKGQPVAVNAPSGPVEARAPWEDDALAEAAALSAWTESIRVHGYSTKEIIDHSMVKFSKALKDLTASEREALGKELMPA